MRYMVQVEDESRLALASYEGRHWLSYGQAVSLKRAFEARAAAKGRWIDVRLVPQVLVRRPLEARG